MSPIPKPHLLGVLAGLFMASGLIVSTTLLTRTWLKVADAESITVTGSARRNVSSDLIVWRGSLSVESPTLLAAQALLAQQETSAREFLIRQGVTNAQFHPIAIQRIQLRTGKQAAEGDTETESSTTRFRLSRAIEVRSGDIDTVLGMDSKTSLLINQGIEFTATTPEFIWTKAGEAKIEMLADAARDARARAEQIVSQGGRAISRMRSAKMGVFQVTPLYSTQNTWDGMNDTTSREKTVTAVVNASYALK
ncbi:MAG: DUF541 domain-containing protein [Proteobacteria bacterium]|nr:DUF541 domain-containing protein [Pseudomonadota bacterium]